jgi:hypothetical protein
MSMDDRHGSHRVPSGAGGLPVGVVVHSVVPSATDSAR